MDVAQLWAETRAGDAGSRGALIERYSDLAVGIARCMRIPSTSLADRDDAASAAQRHAMIVDRLRSTGWSLASYTT